MAYWQSTLVARDLISEGVAVILPSSGTIGNNGALSGITALQTTYTGCYMYFPINAIAAGVAAGLYYVVMSSATAGTIYNNTYTSGVPTRPASPTPFATTGPGAYTQTTGSAITLLTQPVPANTLGINGALHIDTIISNSGSTNSKIQTLAFGGQAITSVTQTTAANVAAYWTDHVVNKGVTNQQVTLNVGTVGHGAVTATNTHLTVDTTQNQNITFTAQLAIATDFIALDAIYAEWMGS